MTTFDKATEIDLEDPLSTFIRLLPTDEKMFQHRPAPIITITWLETATATSGGDDDAALDEACSILKDRVRKILEENPAFAGRLVKSMEKPAKYYIRHPSNLDPSVLESVVNSVFCRFTQKESLIHEGMDPEEQSHACQNAPFLLRRYQEFEHPGWLVSVVPSTKSTNRFAVILSLSHVHYDGASHYLLYNMLMGKERIRPLVNERDVEVYKKGKVAFEKRQTPSNMDAVWGGFLLIFARSFAGAWVRRLHTLITGNHTSPVAHFVVDPAKIQKIKESYVKKREEEPDYISTNDIITSAFFKGTSCSLAMMSIDTRGKLEGRTKDQAGSYSDVVFYRCPQDATTPALIRQSLPDLQRVETRSQPFQLREVALSSMGICTNWSSFRSDHPLDISTEGSSSSSCRQLYHFPCTVEFSTAFCVCYIYELRQGQLACFLSCASPTLMEAAKEALAPVTAPFVLADLLE